MTTVYHCDVQSELHLGDAMSVLATLPDGSVDCVVTSPPQWGLRDYDTAIWTGGNSQCQHTLGSTPHQRRTTKPRRGAEGTGEAWKRCRRCGASCRDLQYGLESTIEDYVVRLRGICAELRRLLTPKGSLWLNLRDSFSYQYNGTGRQQQVRSGETSDDTVEGVPHKCLLGLPWRVVFALQADGWIVRNAIVWHKPNAVPDPSFDRLSSRYEMLFLLVRQTDYYFDGDAIRQPYSQDRAASRKIHRGGTKPHSVKTPWRPGHKGKNPGDVWSMATRPLPDAHCAPFPIDLPLRCIAAGCLEGGTVLDPFSGAGTTGLAALQLERRYLGIDLRGDYHDIFLRRKAAASTRAGGDLA